MSQKPTQECQRADWTAHKAVCQPYAGKKSLAGESGMQNMVVNWVQRNYFFILQQLDRVTHLHHVPKRECLLILDFYAERGTAPALCTPVPIFEIGVTKDFIDGDRHSKLNWFFKGTNVYKTNLQTFRKSLRGHYPRVTSNHLLTIFRYPTGTSGVCNIEFGCAPGSSHSMFSDAALEAFSQAIRHDKDDSSLDRTFSPEFASRIHEFRDICRREGEAPLLEDEMASIARQAESFSELEVKTNPGG